MFLEELLTKDFLKRLRILFDLVFMFTGVVGFVKFGTVILLIAFFFFTDLPSFGPYIE